MKKRLFSFCLFMSLIISLFCGIASATENRASSTLTYYPIGVLAGDNAGEIKISYDVQANKTADTLGISSIKMYRDNGTPNGAYVETITGTTKNGLIRTNAGSHKSTYTYTGTPGETYFAIVTVFATIGDDFDSRKVTTPKVTTPT